MKRGVVLFSGGLRSAIAAKRLAIQMDLIGLHFGKEPEHMRELAKRVGIKRLIIVENIPVNHMIKDVVMLKIAQEIARSHKADILITGRMMGAIGSDSIKKITFLNKQVELDVHRPVLHESKQALIEEAKHNDILFYIDHPNSVSEEQFNQREIENHLRRFDFEMQKEEILKKHLEIVV